LLLIIVDLLNKYQRYLYNKNNKNKNKNK